MFRKLNSQCNIKWHQNFHRDFRQELHRSHLRWGLEGNASSLTRSEIPTLETTNLIIQRQGRGENGTTHGRGQPSSRKKLDSLDKSQKPGSSYIPNLCPVFSSIFNPSVFNIQSHFSRSTWSWSVLALHFISP